MANARCVTHKLIVSAMTILFLFQIAMLLGSMSIQFEKLRIIEKQRTLVLTSEARSITKRRKVPSRQ